MSTCTTPQCQFFVKRKKRLCRMTVKPGRQYCGEHDPSTQANTDNLQADYRIPCPNDPKHTCYASKLEKHLSICNARQCEPPPYIIHNINAPEDITPCPRKPLSEIPIEVIKEIVDKVNKLYEEHVHGKIEPAEETAGEAEATEWATSVGGGKGEGAGEAARRHLRQAGALLRLAERERLVRPGTCYVELGAGRGQLSYFVHGAWCGAGEQSRVLLVDRASPRHKRDNRLGGSAGSAGSGDSEGSEGGAARLRADLAHVWLPAVAAVRRSRRVVGLAKHLCGVATDYALRCVIGACAEDGARGGGLVLAACCHHRCVVEHFVGRRYLAELGLSSEELNVLFGIVSWATCGDGRPRAGRAAGAGEAREGGAGEPHSLSRQQRQEVGRRAKALVDWGRVLFLRAAGLRARLCCFVPPAVSLENTCIVAVAREDSPELQP